MLFTAPYDPNGTNHYPEGNTYSHIVEGPDGFLYVVGSTIFKISKSGTNFQLLEVGGAYGLSLGSDGNFYGSDGNGIFRLTTNGTFTYLSSVSSSGFYVESFSKQATDGNFYGICYSSWWHVCQVTPSGQVTSIFEYPTGTNGRSPGTWVLTQGPDGFLYGVAVGGPGSVAFQVIFQLSTSGSYREVYQSNGCTPKTGCSMVIQTSDDNLWIADPPNESVYSITPTGGVLLQTVSFSGIGHPHLLIQDNSSGILFGLTGEPDPSYYDAGTVFSLNPGGVPTPDFSLSATPASQTVVQGNGTSYTLTLAPSGGFAGNVGLSLGALPAGVNATLNPNPITNGSGTSNLTVNTTSSTTPGTYPLTITGTSGGLTHSTSVALTVKARRRG